ncbi:MAG: FAD-dependent oxidoreductase [Candidatus Woesearchaeota archaeon]
MVKKVAIIGAGPAGLFAAHELVGSHEVTIIDKGKEVSKRKCPVDKGTSKRKKGECTQKCSPCQILTGVGGAGLFSDGKIIFSTKIGNNLTKIVGEERNQQIVDRVEDIFRGYGVEVEEDSLEKIAKIGDLKKIVTRCEDMRFVYARQTHVGTDKLKGLIEAYKKDLEEKGVRFLCRYNVADLNDKEVIIRNRGKKEEKIKYDKVIIAPGRSGAEWLEGIVEKHSIDYTYNPIDIGVRVEVPREITDDITNLVRDMKFYIRTRTYDEEVRTFCTCPGGIVTRETHEGFNLVNGHSEKDYESPNTNFAFLVNVVLTEPLTNTNKYGRDVARLAYGLGGGKPLLQRLGDIRRGRRSKWKKRFEFLVKPTFEDVVYGDISRALPKNIFTGIIEGMDKLNEVIPGVANNSTLLYAPEIKFHGLKVNTNEYLRTNKPNIYVAGDGAGLSRGIVGAACCGILAARGIIEDK